ncbi:hypothetical protein F0562_010931 [Nyssa sinensis]|uniref:Retrotransposon Copia-like N-terminal domain-containing protein n=1 Tax=Nyssa sinensis TaxID=561372 RepID=A0A5J5A3B9_9ASTE|nr:hypothetical protein F0562_010931 [Nyssa sinensis]
MAKSSIPNLPSPYVLHPLDSPSLTLVNRLLTSDNNPQWQRAMTRALNAKNKLGFVDGTLKCPDPTKPEYTQWNQTKDMQADDEKVFQFLLGLNDSFASLRTQILAMDPLSPIDKVFSILFQEEQQRLLNIRPSETIAMVVRPGGRPKSSFKCMTCCKEGHTRGRCWTIVGYPPGRNPRSMNQPSILSQPHPASTRSPWLHCPRVQYLAYHQSYNRNFLACSPHPHLQSSPPQSTSLVISSPLNLIFLSIGAFI